MSAPAGQIALVIPALNEEHALPKVFAELPTGLFRQIIVVDNGSTDQTAAVARRHAAEVVSELRRGYGQACLAGLAHVHPDTDIVVFLDADASDVPGEVFRLLAPLQTGAADLVIGSRRLGEVEPRALYWHQRWGNRLFTALIRLLFGFRFTDLGPFRAVRWRALQQLAMQDRDFGWTVEMQIKAARQGLRIVEVPVRYRRRLGQSKISGTWRGSLRAGVKIFWTILRLRLSR
jgi:glycosyltransferase involved in cell wall biosynthesis